MNHRSSSSISRNDLFGVCDSTGRSLKTFDALTGSLTRMLAPGATGESEQVRDAKTIEGQAESRRVVVRVLQNNNIAGV